MSIANYATNVERSVLRFKIGVVCLLSIIEWGRNEKKKHACRSRTFERLLCKQQDRNWLEITRDNNLWSIVFAIITHLLDDKNVAVQHLECVLVHSRQRKAPNLLIVPAVKITGRRTLHPCRLCRAFLVRRTSTRHTCARQHASSAVS